MPVATESSVATHFYGIPESSDDFLQPVIPESSDNTYSPSFQNRAQRLTSTSFQNRAQREFWNPGHQKFMSWIPEFAAQLWNDVKVGWRGKNLF